ncbi:MAG: hypothetical protein IJH36_10765 [Clostridia bacterium]|nr:hypothetical protein [Clostridia bacterium]MBQ3463571.1 hypothetical protein [Clostridia bacterium]
MKKIISLISVCLIATTLCSCIFSELSMRFHINDSYFDEVESGDNHGGFHGDGEAYRIFDCSKNRDKALEVVSLWEPLPLSENLELIMYGGERNGRSYGLTLANKAHMPKIEHGFYKFYDRHSEARDRDSDSELFNRYSYNFSLAVYDTDTDRLYYFVFDT